MALSSPPSQKPSSIPASRGLRLANALIDGLVISKLALVLFIGSIVLDKFLWVSAQLEGDVSPTLVTSDANPLIWQAQACLIGTWFVYYFVMEGFWGRTLGKLLTRTVVVAADGGRPTWGAVALRTLCRLVPLEALTYLFSRDHHGLHDWASRTRVVRWEGAISEIEV